MDVDKMRTSVRHEGEGDVVIKEENSKEEEEVWLNYKTPLGRNTQIASNEITFIVKNVSHCRVTKWTLEIIISRRLRSGIIGKATFDNRTKRRGDSGETHGQKLNNRPYVTLRVLCPLIATIDRQSIDHYAY